MSFKPQVMADGQWSSNGLAFATKKEAEANAYDLFCRWSGCMDHRAIESDQPVNYSYVTGNLVAVPEERINPNPLWSEISGD